jgi:hypothetical protein
MRLLDWGGNDDVLVIGLLLAASVIESRWLCYLSFAFRLLFVLLAFVVHAFFTVSHLLLFNYISDHPSYTLN